MSDTTPSTDVAPIRDPQTGRLNPGAKLAGGGNPIARLQYQHRRRFLDAVTEAELDKAREQLIEDMYDQSARVRQAARAQYFDIVLGKATQTHEISRADEGGSSRSAMEDKMGRILDALEDHPDVRSKVADILLSGGDQPIEVIATVVTEISTEIAGNGQVN